MSKRPQDRSFAVNKSISLPLGLAAKILERAEMNNRSFSEEITSLVRLALQVIADGERREAEKEINKGG